MLVERLTGIPWELLRGEKTNKNQPTLDLGKIKCRTHIYQANSLVPTVAAIHEDWLNILRDNKGWVRMCHHDEETLYCGECFQGNGMVCPVTEVESTRSNREEKERKPKEERISKDKLMKLIRERLAS